MACRFQISNCQICARNAYGGVEWYIQRYLVDIVQLVLLNFFINFGADIVEPTWSIERYFDFVLLLMSSTAIAFQLPVLQFILGSLGIITTEKMLSNWKIVVISSAILSAVITPSTDPLTMSLLSISIIFLFFIGAGLTYISESLKSKTLSSSH